MRWGRREAAAVVVLLLLLAVVGRTALLCVRRTPMLAAWHTTRAALPGAQVMNLIGDVKGKVAVLVDDMIDTAGTITNAAKVLRAVSGAGPPAGHGRERARDVPAHGWPPAWRCPHDAPGCAAA